LGAAVALVWFFGQAFEEVPAHADEAGAREQGQGGGGVSENGDVNGDGARDLSDAVYILTFLFQGGPEPLPCPGAAGAGGGPVGTPLPDTGQTLCYDAAGLVVACAGTPAACPGQDGGTEIGCQLTNPDRFILDDGGTPDLGSEADRLDDTVIDNCTGLMWTRNQMDITGDDMVLDEDDHLSWCDALDFCDTLTYAGFDDWRLPNIREFLSIVNHGSTNPAHFGAGTLPDNGAFPNAQSTRRFWSSTTNNGVPNRAWAVEFSAGFSDNDDKTDNIYRILAVRKVLPGDGGAGRGQGAGVSGNGDVNGDLTIDLSDAVYLLAFLFQGGPAPLDCPGVATETVCDDNMDDDNDGATDCADTDCSGDPSCQPQGGTGLPDTGQTLCYDDDVEIDCALAVAGNCPSQDGNTETGCQPGGRFQPNGDGTVTDTCTGLMWEQDTGNAGNPLSFCGALAYCDNLDLGTHMDWRPPNIRELASIADYGRTDPAIDTAFFADTQSLHYWSSTSFHHVAKSDLGWCVDFRNGKVFLSAKEEEDLPDNPGTFVDVLFPVRAVRTAP